MAVRTKLLVATRFTQLVAGAGTTIYTAPPDETAIVKSVYVWNESAANGRPDLNVRDPTSINFPFNKSTVGTGDILALDPIWVVIPAGYSLRVQPNTVGAWRFVVSGTELEGVAD